MTDTFDKQRCAEARVRLHKQAMGALDRQWPLGTDMAAFVALAEVLRPENVADLLLAASAPDSA